ncbi:MAG: carboxypeptidase regulatory-like domain-containing protein, partial [bacterium]
MTTGIDFALRPGGSISGRVTDSSNNAVAGAYVSASLFTGPCCGFGSAMSGADGTYAIQVLPAGDYLVTASADGFAAQYYDHSEDYLSATPVVVVDGQNSEGVDFQLSELPTPTPTATETDTPTVTPTPTDTSTPTPCPTEGCPTPTPTATPNPNLDLSISGPDCESGTADTSCFAAVGSDVTLLFNAKSIGSKLLTDGYVGYDFWVQYRGAISYVPASLVQTGAGVWPDCVFSASDASVTGAVVAACAQGIGAPPSSYSGVLLRLDFHCDDYGAGTVTLVNREYQTDLLDAVDYTSQHESTDESVRINCGSTGLPLGAISGTVRDDGGRLIQGAAIDFYGSFCADGCYGATSDAEGQYTITDLPTGDYILHAGRPGEVGEYYTSGGGATDIGLAESLTLPEDGSITGVDFALPQAKVIRGQVTDVLGSPIPDATVSYWGPSCSNCYGATTDAHGQFMIVDLPVGDYTLFASGSGYVGEYYTSSGGT